MASLFETLKKAAVAVFDPKRHEETGELEYLRQVYLQQNDNIRPRQWYRIVSESGNCVGFSYVCSCHAEHQLISAFEWMRDYHCQVCKDKFDLLKFVGITKDVPPAKWEQFFSKLPIRPRLTGLQRPRAIDTWENVSGDTAYERGDLKFT